MIVHEKTRLIFYQCSKCNYKINNNHQHFLNHIDHQHPDLLEVNFCLSPLFQWLNFVSFRMKYKNLCQIFPFSRSFFSYEHSIQIMCSCTIYPFVSFSSRKHAWIFRLFFFFFRCLTLFYSICHCLFCVLLFRFFFIENKHNKIHFKVLLAEVDGTNRRVLRMSTWAITGELGLMWIEVIT